MSDKDDTWEMLSYVELKKKIPHEIEALKSTIKSNEINQQLAEETLKHFKDSKKS